MWFTAKTIGKPAPGLATADSSAKNERWHLGPSPGGASGEGDVDFEKELASLGFRRDDASPPMSKDALHGKLMSWSSLEDIDESQIMVSEQDLSNPEFLDQLDAFQSETSDKSAIHEGVRSVDKKDEEIQTLKAEAIRLKREGRQAEALVKYRQAKAIEEEDAILERRVETVRTLARSHQVEVENAPTESVGLLPDSTLDAIVETSTPEVGDGDIDVQDEPRGSAEEARRMAVLLRKQGRVDEALMWLRYAKTKEAPSSSSSQPNSSPGITLEAKMAYQSLEANLRKAMQLSLEEAKRLRVCQPAEAASMMRRYKGYESSLNALASHQSSAHPPPCPAFHWKTVKREVPLQIQQDLGEDSVEITIEKMSNASQLLSQHIGLHVSIHYDLSIPLDNPVKGVTPKVRINKENVNNLVVHYSARYEVPRKKSYAKTLSRKRMRFEIVLHRGFLLKDDVLAIVTLSLQDLVKNHSCGSDELPLCNASGRALGGCLSTQVRIRYPYDGAKTQVIEESILEVEPWAPSKMVEASEALQTPSNNDRFAILNKLEREDPLNVELYLSNDALEKEIERVDAEISKGTDEGLKLDLDLRRSLLQVKLSLLVRRVQNEELSVADYLSQLRERIERDKVLALFCSTGGRRAEALLVMRRVLVMEEEVKGAAEL